jgi:hypothetical protein
VPAASSSEPPDPYGRDVLLLDIVVSRERRARIAIS